MGLELLAAYSKAGAGRALILTKACDLAPCSDHVIGRELAAIAIGLDLDGRMIDLEPAVQLLR